MDSGSKSAFKLDARLMKVFRAGETVFAQGARGKEMYIVYSGRVDLLVHLADGESRIATVQPGEFFGEMALIDDSPRSAAAVAAENDTTVIVLDKANLVELLRRQPEIGVIMMQTLCSRLRATNEALAKARK